MPGQLGNSDTAKYSPFTQCTCRVNYLVCSCSTTSNFKQSYAAWQVRWNWRWQEEDRAPPFGDFLSTFYTFLLIASASNPTTLSPALMSYRSDLLLPPLSCDSTIIFKLVLHNLQMISVQMWSFVLRDFTAVCPRRMQQRAGLSWSLALAFSTFRSLKKQLWWLGSSLDATKLKQDWHRGVMTSPGNHHTKMGMGLTFH